MPQSERLLGFAPIAHVRYETAGKLQREDALQLPYTSRIAQTAPGDGVKARVPKPLPRILPSVGHGESRRLHPVALQDAPTRRLNGLAPSLRRHLSVAREAIGMNASKTKRHRHDGIRLLGVSR